jgi:cytochrome c oxidase subunit 2
LSRRSFLGSLSPLFAVGAVLALAGCSDNRQSTLDPHSEPARRITTLWWVMLAIASVVFAGAVAMLVIGYFRRRRAGFPIVGEESNKTETALVVAFGMVIPIIVLVGLFAVADVGPVIAATDAPAKGSTKLRVEAIGRQWFWAFRYPGGATTANEMHIPVDTRVDVIARTGDVIHSFWVPELNRKVDTIPGHDNEVLLYADHPGVYRGQCAEFCGLQHANMAMTVVAQEPAAFRAWLRAQQRPAAEPGTPAARRGERTFLSQACAGCHQIKGTSARGSIGPDLTHLASRSELAGLVIPNDPAHLRAWIANPQAIKPGNKMPGLNLTGRELDDLVAYLHGLK